MNLRDVELELANYLVAQTPLGGVTLSSGPAGNVWVGELPAAAPDVSVLVRETPGQVQSVYLGSTSGVVEANAQVIIRGAPNERAAAQTLARAVWAALNLAPVTSYILVEAEQTPATMGSDGSGRPQYLFNLRCLYAG
jgi:hypothetical protein